MSWVCGGVGAQSIKRGNEWDKLAGSVRGAIGLLILELDFGHEAYLK